MRSARRADPDLRAVRGRRRHRDAGEQAVDRGFEVAIVTGDKDFFQLVHDGLKVYNPKEEGTWFDAEGVNEKFGVAPEQVVDVLALMGDSIDNIKGVPGIGEKGARDLIATYGDLENLLAKAPEMSNKRYREGLHNHAEDARQSRELARIRTDVPVDIRSRRRSLPRRQPGACFELFTAARFQFAGDGVCADGGNRGQRLRWSDARGRAGLRRSCDGKRFALRVIPDQTAAMLAGIVGISFSTAPRRARYMPFVRGAAPQAADCSTGRCQRAPRRRWSRCAASAEGGARGRTVQKVGHDLKFDAIVLGRHGVDLQGIETDTMLASYLLDATRSGHPLEDLALEHAGYKALQEEDVCGRGAKAIPFAGSRSKSARVCRRTSRPGAADVAHPPRASEAVTARGSTRPSNCR